MHKIQAEGVQRIRTEIEANYFSILTKEGRTFCFAIDEHKPITELKYPEFLDVGLTPYCQAECPYCYQNAKNLGGKEYTSGAYGEEILRRLTTLLENYPEEHMPYYIAFGGGEPTTLSTLPEILKISREYRIFPSYSTNGIILRDDVIEATIKYCLRVALSMHPALEKYWEPFFSTYKSKVGIVMHVLVSDLKSVERLKELHKTYAYAVEHILVLPVCQKGEVRGVSDEVWDSLNEYIEEQASPEAFSFGANFYSNLQKSNPFEVLIYPPEILSKYVDLPKAKVYRSSFETAPLALSDVEFMQIG